MTAVNVAEAACVCSATVSNPVHL